MYKEIDEILLSSKFMKQRGYWVNKLSLDTGIKKTALLYKSKQNRETEKKIEKINLPISHELFDRMMKLGKQSDLSLYIILLTALKLFVYRFTTNEDVIVISPVYKKNKAMETLNHYVFIRDSIDSRLTFIDLLLKVKKSVLEAYENQDYPSSKLIEYLSNSSQGETENPDSLSDIGCLLLNIHDDDMIEDVKDRLIFCFEKNTTGSKACILYDKNVYDREYVGLLAKHFVKILNHTTGNIKKKTSVLSFSLNEEEKQFILDFNRTQAKYPKEKTLVELFEEQAMNSPDRAAAVDKRHAITYRELNEKANQLARRLIEKQVKTGSIVALMMERSVEMLIALFAVLKAGGAFLPIDHQYPEKRKQFILKDSKARVLITQKLVYQRETQDIQRFIAEEIIYPVEKDHSTGKTSNLEVVRSPRDPAYVIYTSGTGGKPKGVLIRHQAIVNYTWWAARMYVKNEPVNFPLYTSISFDLTMTSIFTPLLTGNTILVYGEREKAAVLEQVIAEDKVGVIKLTPSHLELIKHREDWAPPGILKRFIVGGEQLQRELALEITGKYCHKIEIYNEYGPTEAAVGCMIYRFSSGEETGENVPIGKPAANTQIYILDKQLKPVPPGVPGELCIGGDGLAAGYLNRPELTAGRFIKKALSSLLLALRKTGCNQLGGTNKKHNKKFLPGGPGGAVFSKRVPPGRRRQELYRTGDLAKWLLDGNIVFLGRMDDQVKISGFRIQLDEIEQVLMKHKEIEEAVVISGENGKISGQLLYAYIVGSKELEISQLREYLSTILPIYMIPTYFMKLEKIPLTLNGKPDRHALLRLAADKPGDKYTAPRNEWEEKLETIWSEVLGIEKNKIGIDANFFQLGGHSLRATILVSKIHKKMNVKLPLVQLFMTPTIRGQAGYLQGAVKENCTSLEAVEKQDYYALSSAQKRLYFLQQVDIKSTGYNMPLVLPVGKNIKKDRLEATLKKLVARHEGLRTSFMTINEIPVQRIHHQVEFDIEHYDLESSHHSLFIIHHSFVRPFDLSQAPLLRSGLIRLEDGNHIWLIDMHHIISDGTSHVILTEDFISLYDGEKLKPLRIQYKDFSQWQNRFLESRKIAPQKKYWLELYTDAPEVPRLDLPADFKRPEIFTFEGDKHGFMLESEDAARLKALSLENNGTIFMNLLTALNTLFHKYSGQTDIIIGCSVSGRPHADMQQIVGMFINKLPIRNFPRGEKTYESFLREVIAHSMEAFENQDFQFEELVDKLEIERDFSRNPLFDVSLVVQNLRHAKVNHLIVENLPTIKYKNLTSKFDLAFIFSQEGEDIYFTIEYYTNIFRTETILRLESHLKNIIKAVVKDPCTRLEDIELISDEEKQQVLYEFNDTSSPYLQDKTIHELFEEQVKKKPDSIVVVGMARGNRGGVPIKGRREAVMARTKPHHSPRAMHHAITYKSLYEESKRLARKLQSKSVKPGTITAIIAEPSIETTTGVLAVLKAGGAFLPIEPTYPEERIKYMLNDSKVSILLIPGQDLLNWNSENKSNCETGVQLDKLEYVNLVDISSEVKYEYENKKLPRDGQAKAADIVYTIYTSGSTGQPKGVLVENRNLLNYVTWFSSKAGLTGASRTILVSSLAFDLGYTVFFSSLLTGGILHMAAKELALSPDDLLNYINANDINYIKLTPSHFNTLAHSPSFTRGMLGRLELIVLGGEKINVIDVERMHNIVNGIKIMNHYGPTEATIGSVARFIDFDKLKEYKSNPTIGKPIANTNVYILDKGLNVLPIGVSGELCISGACLARGYLNRPDLTAEKFCLRRPGGTLFKKTAPPGPPRKNFLLEEASPGPELYPRPYALGPRLYQTGDLGRWLTNGNIEFLGRIDHQVKVRGYRIELGEIESRLLKHQQIKDAAVLVIDGEQDDKYICAYLVAARAGDNLDTDSLRDYLVNRLPGYMVPSYFLQIECIPLTANRKVDRKALPEPGQEASRGSGPENGYVPPAGIIEKELVKIWADVLGIEADKIGIHANFFQLGGHSLNATILLARMYKALKVKVPLAELFQSPVISSIAQYIMKAAQETYFSIEPAEKKEYYPLSPAQMRMYILKEQDRKSTTYNMPTTLELEGELDVNRLENTFALLIQRHETLRTSFEMKEEEPVQRVHDKVNSEIEYYCAERKAQSAERKEERYAPSTMRYASTIKDFVHPFDLSRAPLMRVGLIAIDSTHHLLFVDIHHIINDGTSLGIFIKEFSTYYSGRKLPGLKVQFKDYSVWQQRIANSEKGKEHYQKQQAFWLEHFKGDIPVLRLPTDCPRSKKQSNQGSGSNFIIGKEETRKLNKIVSEEGATLYMILLAILNVMLAKITGDETIITGAVLAGRRHTDLEPVMGMFINTLALKNDPSPGKTFSQFFREVKEITLTAFENQDYPFEELVHQLGIKRDVCHNPLFDVLFTLRNLDMPGVSLDRLSVRPYKLGFRDTKFDLCLAAAENNHELHFSFVYKTALFKKETIERYSGYFKEVVTAVTANKHTRLKEITISHKLEPMAPKESYGEFGF